AGRFDLATGDGSQRAAEWIVGIMNAAKLEHRLGLEVKQGKVLDELSRRLHVSIETLTRLRRQLQRPDPRLASAAAAPATSPTAEGSAVVASGVPATPIRLADLDRTDVELMQVALEEPAAIEWLATRVSPSSLRDGPLRTLLHACYDLHAE